MFFFIFLAIMILVKNLGGNILENTLKNKLANPAPLGLAGFGMTTILLNLHNAGFIELSDMILVMGIFYGGFAQIIAGILEFKKGNTFGTLAFTSYGCFWWSLVGIIVMSNFGFMVASPVSMGWYLLMWGIFTLFLFFGTLNGPKVGQGVFLTLTILFFLLAASEFTGSAAIHTFAGYEGMVCGALALYEAMAQVLNEKYNRVVLPL